MGDTVLLKDYKNLEHSIWSEGEVIGQEGSVMFDGKIRDGKECRCHSNPLKPSTGVSKSRGINLLGKCLLKTE